MTLDQTFIHPLLSFYSLIPVFFPSYRYCSLLHASATVSLFSQNCFYYLLFSVSATHLCLSFIYFFSFTASSSFCRWVNITGGQKAPLQQRVKRRETGTHTIVIYRWMKWLLSISFLFSLPSRITHNICTPTELL